MKRETELELMGCGLFFWDSKLTSSKKIEILTWYKSLSKKQKEFVEALLTEAKEDAEFTFNESNY